MDQGKATNMQDSQATTRQEVRREVSGRGKFLAFGIIAIGLIVSIFIEKFGAPESIRNIPYILLGALVLAIAIPMAFYRRPIR
jgi:hypothetical protein